MKSESAIVTIIRIIKISYKRIAEIQFVFLWPIKIFARFAPFDAF